MELTAIANKYPDIYSWEVQTYPKYSIFTGCPTDMLTTSDPILQFLNPHVSKSKTCFEKFKTKAFRWHLETQQSQIGSIFKLNIKKSIKSEKWFCTLPPQLKMPPAPLPPGKKKCFCTLPPQLIMPPAPLPPGNNSFISLYAKVSFSS